MTALGQYLYLGQENAWPSLQETTSNPHIPLLWLENPNPILKHLRKEKETQLEKELLFFLYYLHSRHPTFWAIAWGGFCFQGSSQWGQIGAVWGPPWRIPSPPAVPSWWVRPHCHDLAWRSCADPPECGWRSGGNASCSATAQTDSEPSLHWLGPAMDIHGTMFRTQCAVKNKHKKFIIMDMHYMAKVCGQPNNGVPVKGPVTIQLTNTF